MGINGLGHGNKDPKGNVVKLCEFDNRVSISCKILSLFQKKLNPPHLLHLGILDLGFVTHQIVLKSYLFENRHRHGFQAI